MGGGPFRGTAGAAAGAAGSALVAAARSTSRLTMLPLGPLPLIESSEMPCCSARRRASGEIRTARLTGSSFEGVATLAAMASAGLLGPVSTAGATGAAPGAPTNSSGCRTVASSPSS